MERFLSILLVSVLAGCSSGGLKDGFYTVRRAISGDSIELESGRVVRYAGIVAPATGEPFFEESRLRNDTFTVGRDIKVELRFLRGVKDAEERPYATVLVPARALTASVLVNTELLEAGLARIDFKTVPAGKDGFFEVREQRARRDKRGIWSLKR